MFCKWKHCHRDCGWVIIRDGGFRGTHKRDAENLRWPNPVGRHSQNAHHGRGLFLLGHEHKRKYIYMWPCKLAFNQNYMMWAEFQSDPHLHWSATCGSPSSAWISGELCPFPVSLQLLFYFLPSLLYASKLWSTYDNKNKNYDLLPVPPTKLVFCPNLIFFFDLFLCLCSCRLGSKYRKPKVTNLLQ